MIERLEDRHRLAIENGSRPLRRPTDGRPSPLPTTPPDRWATEAVRASFDAIDDDGRCGIWIDLVDREWALLRAAEIDRRTAAGDHLPLAGRTLAVKGNIDVVGLDTTAGCPAYAYRPKRSATVVRALTSAGAVVIGTTNLDQFATGMTGTRSPFGACPNAHWDDFVSGGSSAGSAVAVATGLIDLALATDTAGSCRVPAAANGIVGLKPTRGLVSASGVVPACASVDCVSFLSRDVDLAATALHLAAGPDPKDPWSRQRPSDVSTPRGRLRIGMPALETLSFAGDESGSARHARALSVTVEALDRTWPAGITPVEVVVADMIEAGRLLYEGAFVAERYAAVGRFVDDHPDCVDPIVGRVISDAASIPAWRLSGDLERLVVHRRHARQIFERIDVLVLPTVPRIPTTAEAHAEPLTASSMLGTYSAFVNLLDLCAVAMPVRIEGPGQSGPPPSLMFIAPAWHDRLLVDLVSTIGRADASNIGVEGGGPPDAAPPSFW